MIGYPFLAKSPFISKKNASNEIPLKSPFKAVNYDINLRRLRANTNPSVVFKTLKFTFAISQEPQK